jgi:hypothetical protein
MPHVLFATYTLIRTNLSNPKKNPPGSASCRRQERALGEPFRETQAINWEATKHPTEVQLRPSFVVQWRSSKRTLVVERRASLSLYVHVPHKAGEGVMAAVDLMFLLHLWPHTRDMKSANGKFRRQLKKCSSSMSRIVMQLEAAAEMVASCQPHCSHLGLRRCLQRSRRGIVEVFSSILAGGTCTQGNIVDKPLEVNLYTRLDLLWTFFIDCATFLLQLHSPK